MYQDSISYYYKLFLWAIKMLSQSTGNKKHEAEKFGNILVFSWTVNYVSFKDQGQ